MPSFNRGVGFPIIPSDPLIYATCTVYIYVFSCGTTLVDSFPFFDPSVVTLVFALSVTPPNGITTLLLPPTSQVTVPVPSPSRDTPHTTVGILSSPTILDKRSGMGCWRVWRGPDIYALASSPEQKGAWMMTTRRKMHGMGGRVIRILKGDRRTCSGGGDTLFSNTTEAWNIVFDTVSHTVLVTTTRMHRLTFIPDQPSRPPLTSKYPPLPLSPPHVHIPDAGPRHRCLLLPAANRDQAYWRGRSTHQLLLKAGRVWADLSPW